MGVLLLLAVSVSLDSLGISVAYAISGIRIPWITRIVIAVINMLFTAGAMFFGQKLGVLIPSFWFRLIGGSVLVVLGGRTLRDILRENDAAVYDKDSSHTLEPGEGAVLGLTLTLDSVCAGLGIGGMGMTAYLFPVLTGCANLIFFTAGTKMNCNFRYLNGAAGVVLILLGVVRLFVS